MVQSSIIRKADDTFSQADMVQWLRSLRGKGFPALSHFDVCAVFKVKAGNEYWYVAGVNVENADLIVGTCAEEGALAAVATAFGQHAEVVEGWVMGAPGGVQGSAIACYPCGECRQRMAHYAAPDAPIHIVTLNGDIIHTLPFGELLPHAFSFRDLTHLEKHGTVNHKHPLAVEDRIFRVSSMQLTTQQIAEWLLSLKADVQVTAVHKLAVVRTEKGAYAAGVALENAAYPSSTNAVQSALAVMHARFGRQKVVEAWYMVRRGSAILAEPLSGCMWQVLYTFATGKHIPVHTFMPDGKLKTMPFPMEMPVFPAARC